MVFSFWIEKGIELVIGIILGTSLYWDARSRDYNWTVWVFFPVLLLLMPLVTSIAMSFGLVLVYYYFRPKGNLVPCPHCKRRIHNILAFCPFCRKSVKRECLRCHETVDWEVTICPHCRSAQLTDR